MVGLASVTWIAGGLPAEATETPIVWSAHWPPVAPNGVVVAVPFTTTVAPAAAAGVNPAGV